MPLRGMGFSIAGLGKVAKRLFDLRIGGGGGGGGGDPPPEVSLPENQIYVRGPLLYPIGSNTSYISRTNVLTLQDGVDFDEVSIGVSFGAGIANGSKLYLYGLANQGRLASGFGSSIAVYYPYFEYHPTILYRSVACGGAYALTIRHLYANSPGGTLWSQGYSLYGGIGQGATNQSNNQTQLGTDQNWKEVFAGGDTSFAIKTDGTLWAWGYNNKGQLGLGDTTNRTTPTQVGTDTDWEYVSVAPEGYNATALKTNGTLWFAGSSLDRNSGLGQSQTADVLTFTQIGTDTDWVKVKNCGAHTVAIKSNGTLWGWGGNYSYALASSGAKYVPTQIGSDTWSDVDGETNTTWGIKSDGTLWSVGSGSYGKNGNPASTATLSSFTQYGTANNWSWVVRGRNNFLFKNTEGEIYWIGYQQDPINKLNSFTFTEYDSGSWAKVLLSQTGFVGLKSDGDLWVAAGYSGYTAITTGSYQIGVGDTWKDVAICANEDGISQVTAIKTDGTLWQLGLDFADSSRNSTTWRQIGSDSDWVSVVSQSGYTGIAIIALKEDGTVWAYGSNATGSLGQGDTTLRTDIVQVGSSTWSSIWVASNAFFMINSSGTMYSWGSSSSALLNQVSFVDRSTPGEVNGGAVWKQVRTGIAAIKTDGTLWTWGGLASTNNGISLTATATQVGTATDWIDATIKSYAEEGAKGATTTYATAFGIRGSNGKGDLYGWGYNALGNAGTSKVHTAAGFTNPVSSPTLISSGNFTSVTCAPPYYLAGSSSPRMDVALEEIA